MQDYSLYRGKTLEKRKLNPKAIREVRNKPKSSKRRNKDHLENNEINEILYTYFISNIKISYMLISHKFCFHEHSAQNSF